MYCPSCGKEIPDDSEFCHKCGESIGQKTADNQPIEDTQEDESDESSRWDITLGKIIAYPVGGLLILAGIGGLVDSVAAGLVIIASGVIALPIVRQKLEKSQGIALSRWATVAIVLIAFLSGALILGAVQDNGADPVGENEEEVNGANGDSSEPGFDYTMNESFVVDGEEQSIRYEVQNAFTADIVDPGGARQQPDGEFLIVVMELENTGDEAVDIRTRHLKLVDQDDRDFETDTRTVLDVAYDHRVGIEGLSSEQLQPGLTLERAVVFDVPPDQDYRLKIEPAEIGSNGDEYYVELETQELE